jgi:hypothetical protein
MEILLDKIFTKPATFVLQKQCAVNITISSMQSLTEDKKISVTNFHQ